MKTKAILKSYVLGAMGLFCLLGCKSESAGSWDRTSDRMELIVQYSERVNEYNVAGDFDSVVITTLPLFVQAVRDNDTLVASWIGIFIAQAYMSMQQLDSVAVYLERLEPMMENCTNFNIMMAYYSTIGNYAMKSRLDYAYAIRCFLETLLWAEKAGSVRNQIAVTYDIVYLFYILGDGSGLEYAENAYSMALTQSRKSPQYVMALTMMGMMNIMTGDIECSSKYLDSARVIAVNERYSSLIPDIDMFLGDVARISGNRRYAIEVYERVETVWNNTVYPSTIIRTCLLLGECYKDIGKVDEALDYFAEGLSISYSTGVMEFRKELLLILYKTCYESGETDAAVGYYRAYEAFEDSIADMASEQKFYALLRKYKELEYENKMTLSTISLQKSRQRTLLLAFAVIVVSGVSIVFYVQRKHQKQMFLQLFDKHQKYLEYFNSRVMEQETAKSSGNEADKELFVRIERLMREENIFRQKGLTLDSLAEKLDTNRTYVSRAINAFSGKTFVNYINAFRINEAVRIISAPDTAVNAKQLAEELGYASVNVFYQVFQRETGLSLSRYKKELGLMESHMRAMEGNE